MVPKVLLLLTIILVILCLGCLGGGCFCSSSGSSSRSPGTSTLSKSSSSGGLSGSLGRGAGASRRLLLLGSDLLRQVHLAESGHSEGLEHCHNRIVDFDSLSDNFINIRNLQIDFIPLPVTKKKFFNRVFVNRRRKDRDRMKRLFFVFFK